MLCPEILPYLPDIQMVRLGIIQILHSQTTDFPLLWNSHNTTKNTELKS